MFYYQNQSKNMANYGYGQGPPPAGYGAPGAGGYPQQGQPGYGAPPQGGYGAPPQAGGYGAPPTGYPGQPGAPGYGAPPQAAGYGAPTQPGMAGFPGMGAPPGIDPQVLQWFQTVDQDRSGRINALELQQALVNGNWSHFNPETCRLMIGMFDRDNTGQIELNEFQALWNYIQQWKGVFERFDTNRTGHIEHGELTSALQSMGYNLSPQFINILIVKFDIQGRRSLTLDNFIQACVMIKSLTDMFKARDTGMTGTVRLSYEDFMCMAVSSRP